MKEFINDDFLLESNMAEWLYHQVAADCPVIDYHNHLDPQHIAENRQLENIAQLWVTKDQYKHRAMRINGIPEEYITGTASDKEKFLMWAKTIKHTVGNPLFHWSGLELKRLFGIDEILSEANAENVWQSCNQTMSDQSLTTLDVLKQWKVETLCTSDDLLDDLTSHKKATSGRNGLEVLPSLRADSIVGFDRSNFTSWFNRLEDAFGRTIKNIDDYKEAVISQLDRFDDAGCLLADLALDSGFEYQKTDGKKANALFIQHIVDNGLLSEEFIQLKSHIMHFLGEQYARRKWVMQLHIGAQRHTSSRLKRVVGPAGGFATIGNTTNILSLCTFLDNLEMQQSLPKVILYNLNPNDNPAFATVTGSFVEDNIPAKIQFGPAWWYNDHFDGIESQLKMLANHGLISRFIGFTSDSRSFLSLSRHEYFRRILCNMIGNMVRKGHLPDDKDLLAELVRNISYNNAKNWMKRREIIYEN